MGEFLKINAEKFIENAEYLLRKGEYNLAAFNFEQAAQLLLKYFLWKKIGDFPKTHSISKLIDEASKVSQSKTDLIKLKESETTLILEEAYLNTRYFETYFTKTHIEKIKNFVETLKTLLEQ